MIEINEDQIAESFHFEELEERLEMTHSWAGSGSPDLEDLE